VNSGIAAKVFIKGAFRDPGEITTSVIPLPSMIAASSCIPFLSEIICTFLKPVQ
jgi:hypothetical protein